MNILLVVTGLPDKESPARSVFNLTFARELIEKGQQVTILYLRAVNPSKSFIVNKNISEIKCFEIRSTIPKFGFTKNSSFQSNLFCAILKNKRLSKHLEQIDIIHAIGGGSLEASYLISKRFHIRMISQFIGSDLNVHFSSLLKKKNFLKGIEKSNFLCFNSKGLKDVFLNKFPEKKNTKVLYRGIKLDDFTYYFKQTNIINILFLGGFPSNDNLKGGFTVIKTIKLLKNEMLSTSIRITIGGPNSLNYKHFSKEIQNPKIQLDFIGAVPKALVKDKMKKSNIVLIPSISEGLPNVLYEAMASGNMVIASEVGGIPEVLVRGETGELIPPDNAVSLMTTIKKAINDRHKIEKYAEKGRIKIRDMDYNNFIQGYIQIYKKLT